MSLGDSHDPQQIPVPYKPRNWARRFHRSFHRFAAMVMHRRAGKTTSVLNHHQRAACDDGWERQRLLHLDPTLTSAHLAELINPPGGRHYGHVMPTLKQAKVVAWDKLKYYARVVPGVKFNEQELLVRYPNGNKVQLFGADNPDSLRGLALSGVSLDEFSQQDPQIFATILSKALADHLGYAIFLGTIKGEDHLFKTYQAAKHDTVNWFALWQDIDTSIATEDGATVKLLFRAMADDRKLIADGLMSQEDFDQEWFLSSEAALKGTWFQKEMAAMKAEGRICPVPREPLLPVDTDWDLGIDDYMSVIFSQTSRSGQIRIIDYLEETGEGFPFFVKALAEKGYVYGKHYAPHDIKVRELGTGKSRLETAESLGLTFEVVQVIPFVEGINAVRLTLPKVWIDHAKGNRLVQALTLYRKKLNTQTGLYTGVPVHNGDSHAADAMRGLSVRHQPPKEPTRNSQPEDFQWDPTTIGTGWMR